MKRPQQFSIEIRPVFTPATHYHFENGTLHVSSLGQEPRVATPTNQQWSGFYRLCNFLDLWNWLPVYTERESSRDGEAWQLEIAFDQSQRVQSQGVNAYPSLEDVQQPVGTLDRFGLLLHFVDITLLSNSVDPLERYTPRGR